MKKGVWLVALVGLAAASAFAMGSLITSFPITPGWIASDSLGLGYVDSTHLCGTTYYDCYTLLTANGSITHTFRPFLLTGHSSGGCDYGRISGARGAVFWGDFFNPGFHTQGYVYRSTPQGSILSSFAAPIGGSVLGIAFRPLGTSNYLILTMDQPYPDRSGIYRVDAMTGQLYASYDLGFYAADLAHDDARHCYWIAAYVPEVSGYKEIRYVNYMGQTIGSFACADGNEMASGVAYDPVNRHLYVGDYATPPYIYVYETEESDGRSGITPASLGKVKAVFR